MRSVFYTRQRLRRYTRLDDFNAFQGVKSIKTVICHLSYIVQIRLHYQKVTKKKQVDAGEKIHLRKLGMKLTVNKPKSQIFRIHGFRVQLIINYD